MMWLEAMWPNFYVAIYLGMLGRLEVCETIWKHHVYRLCQIRQCIRKLALDSTGTPYVTKLQADWPWGFERLRHTLSSTVWQLVSTPCWHSRRDSTLGEGFRKTCSRYGRRDDENVIREVSVGRECQWNSHVVARTGFPTCLASAGESGMTMEKVF